MLMYCCFVFAFKLLCSLRFIHLKTHKQFNIHSNNNKRRKIEEVTTKRVKIASEKILSNKLKFIVSFYDEENIIKCLK